MNALDTLMPDDEILRRAELIKARRRNEARLSAFRAKDTVMVRWDNPGAAFGESYTSVTLPRSAINEALIAKALNL